LIDGVDICLAVAKYLCKKTLEDPYLSLQDPRPTDDSRHF